MWQIHLFGSLFKPMIKEKWRAWVFEKEMNMDLWASESSILVYDGFID